MRVSAFSPHYCVCGVAYPSARIKGGVPGNKMATENSTRSGTGAEPLLRWSASLAVLAGFSNDIAAACALLLVFEATR